MTWVDQRGANAVKREITTARIRLAPMGSDENVVERLRRRIAEVRSTGTVVRTDWLDGQQPSWCDLRGTRTIILDATQPAAEQLSQLEEILTEITRSLPGRTTSRAA